MAKRSRRIPAVHSEAVRMLKLFDAAGILAAPYKGPF